METAGAVCLPAAGYRRGSSGDALVDDVGRFGYYWSASPNAGSSAYALEFYGVNVNPNNKPTLPKAARP